MSYLDEIRRAKEQQENKRKAREEKQKRQEERAIQAERQKHNVERSKAAELKTIWDAMGLDQILKDLHRELWAKDSLDLPSGTYLQTDEKNASFISGGVCRREIRVTYHIGYGRMETDEVTYHILVRLYKNRVEWGIASNDKFRKHGTYRWFIEPDASKLQDKIKRFVIKRLRRE